MAPPAEFLKRLQDRSPALRAKLSWNDENEEAIEVRVDHQFGAKPDKSGREYIKSLGSYPGAKELVQFYRQFDGLQLCRTFDARVDDTRPLIDFKRASLIQPFTEQYASDGDRGWIIDLRKSSKLYRGTDRWIAFAEVDSGPMCLTLFLDGDDAGKVFFLCPQPQFNILRPIAKSFYGFLERIANDLAGTLRLVRACVCLRGLDGWNYGLYPVEYLPIRSASPKQIQ